MPRRFQFSLRALMVLLSLVAIGFGIWVNLPVSVRVAIIAGACSLLYWVFDLQLWTLLPPYGDTPRHRYVVKWRRRGEKESRE